MSVKNLKTNITGLSPSLTTNHYCDYDSYNTIVTGTRKFTETFYEITDPTEMAKFNTNLGDLSVTEYSSSDHSQEIKPWTLLYIDGALQTNARSCCYKRVEAC